MMAAIHKLVRHKNKYTSEPYETEETQIITLN